MENKKNVIGEVSVEVKAGLSVDERTFRTCMNLVSIYARNNGFDGMVVGFNDPGERDNYFIKRLMTNEETKAAFYATPEMFKEKESEG